VQGVVRFIGQARNTSVSTTIKMSTKDDIPTNENLVDEMSVEEALLLASLVENKSDRHLRALKVIGYHYSQAVKEIIQLEKLIKQLERKSNELHLLDPGPDR
jgi:hypothetical protein